MLCTFSHFQAKNNRHPFSFTLLARLLARGNGQWEREKEEDTFIRVDLVARWNNEYNEWMIKKIIIKFSVWHYDVALSQQTHMPHVCRSLLYVLMTNDKMWWNFFLQSHICYWLVLFCCCLPPCARIHSVRDPLTLWPTFFPRWLLPFSVCRDPALLLSLCHFSSFKRIVVLLGNTLFLWCVCVCVWWVVVHI